MKFLFKKVNNSLLTVVTLLAFSVPSHAINSNYKNTLEQINISKSGMGSYTLNLIFNNNYSEPLNISKRSPKMYSVVLPETQISSNNVKVTYKDGKDNVRLRVDEYPYLDSSINNGYVKITATVNDNSLLKVVSDKNLLPSENKIAKKNIEIINKELATVGAKLSPDPIPPIQAAPNQIAQDANEAKTPENQQPQSKIEPQEESLPMIDMQPPTKKPWNADYLDMIVKMSLLVFIFIVLAAKLKRVIHEKLTSMSVRRSSNNSFAQEVSNQAKDIQQTTENSTISAKKQNRQLDEDDEEENVEIIQPKMTATINPENPQLLSISHIDKNKGFYLITYDGEASLIGYIDDNIYILKRFESLSTKNMQTRLHEKEKNRANYLVRVDNYKALVETTETSMKVLIEF